jgi:hypothetical protein
MSRRIAWLLQPEPHPADKITVPTDIHQAMAFSLVVPIRAQEWLAVGHTFFGPVVEDGIGGAKEQGTVGSGPAVEIFDWKDPAIGVFFVKSQLDFA